MIRAVFFDAGHTLLHAHPDLGTIYAETTSGLGARIAPERFAEAFLPAFREFVRAYAATGTSSDAEDRAMWRAITREIHGRIAELGGVDFDLWFDALYRRFGEPDAWRLYEDVEETLRALRARGLRLGVVSNWDTRLKGICAGLGLDRLVDFLVISAEVGVRKPDRRIFEEALSRAGVRPEEAVHVGDLPEEDVEGARRAGVGAFLIERRVRVTDHNTPEGVPVLKGLGDLLPLLG